MRQLELRTTELDKGKTTYLELLQTCVRAAPPGGLDLSEMEKRLRVLRVLEEAEKDKKKTVDMEDADVETLQHCVAMFRWTGVHEEILTFLKYIRDLKRA